MGKWVDRTLKKYINTIRRWPIFWRDEVLERTYSLKLSIAAALTSKVLEEIERHVRNWKHWS